MTPKQSNRTRLIIILMAAILTLGCSLTSIQTVDTTWEPGDPATTKVTNSCYGNMATGYLLGKPINPVTYSSGDKITVYACGTRSARISAWTIGGQARIVNRDCFDGTGGYDPCDANEP